MVYLSQLGIQQISILIFPSPVDFGGSIMRLIASEVSINRMVFFAAWPYQEGHVEVFVCATLKF